MRSASPATADHRRGGVALGLAGPLMLAAVIAATVAYGAASVATGHPLGTALPPFMLSFEPRASAFLALALVVLPAAVYAGVRLCSARLAPRAFAAGIFALALVTRLALNVVRDGPSELYGVFVVAQTGEGRHEYLPALGALTDGVGPFLDDFAALAPGLPTHASAHPPGTLVLLNALGISSAEGMAALTIIVGALAAPLLFLIGRELYDDRAARVAAVLFVFAPSSLIYGATSADALFVTLGLAAAGALVASKPRVRALGPGLLALASFFSYALLAVGAWAAVVTLLRSGWRRAAALAASSAVALLVFYLGLHLLSGFDLFASLEAANQRYRDGIAGSRPYLFWLFGSPVAFLVGLGLPVAWLAARSLSAREATAVALAAVIIASAVLGYTKAETERIWLFLVPLACLAAAPMLRREALPLTLSALALQAVALEVLFITIW